MKSIDTRKIFTHVYKWGCHNQSHNVQRSIKSQTEHKNNKPTKFERRTLIQANFVSYPQNFRHSTLSKYIASNSKKQLFKQFHVQSSKEEQL